MNTLEKQAWLLSQKGYGEQIQEHWEAVRDINFDEKSGAPYWVKAAKEAGINPKNDLDTLQDFFCSPISLCDESILKVKPITEFIPKSVQKGSTSILTSSGSMGKKKEVAWSETALNYAADYANYCFDRMGIPRSIDWVVQGPYGIFQGVVRRALEKRGGLIHSAGVETRNLKRHFASLKNEEEFSSNQYLQATLGPAIEFTQDILAKEKIGGLVTAIQMLPLFVNFEGFENIEAIYFSGMEIPEEMYKFWRGKLPHIKFISSFGHHNLGFSYSTPFEDEPYYPPSPLSAIYVTDKNDPNRIVGYGERGRHKILRADYAFLWSQLDRDYSVRVAPQEEFKWDGIKDAKPSFEG